MGWRNAFAGALARWSEGIVGAIAPEVLRNRQADALNVMARALTADQMGRLAQFAPGAFQGSAASASANRSKAWQLLIDDGYAIKAVNACAAVVVGAGPRPRSLANYQDGSDQEDEKFRKKAEELWEDLLRSGWFLGSAVSWGELCTQALIETIASGEVLVIKKVLGEPDGSLPKIAIQLVEAERIPDEERYDVLTNKNNSIYRGIEYDPEGNVVAYHVLNRHPNDPRPFIPDALKTTPIPAQRAIHVFRRRRPGQQRGMSWLAGALKRFSNLGELEYNELIAAAAAACVTLMIKRAPASGSTSLLSLSSSAASVDSNGNRQTHMAPGMVVHGTERDSIEGFNPGRPNSQVADFAAHILRGAANCVPGVKGSTVSGNYSDGNFSSDRANENDAWREAEVVQEWFQGAFLDPLWKWTIEMGMLSGYFGDQMKTRYANNKARYSAAEWSFPYQRSINPIDDEVASTAAIRNGTSSPIMEAASRRVDWRQPIRDVKKVLEFCKKEGIEPERVYSWYAAEKPTDKNTQMSASAKPATAKEGLPQTKGNNGHVHHRFAEVA